jgi:prophage tail gpP-like protein
VSGFATAGGGAPLPSPPLPQLTFTVGGYSFTSIMRWSIERDLKDIAGRFELDVMDQARILASLPAQINSGPALPFRLGGKLPCTLAIDGEIVLMGYIGRPRGSWTAETLTMRIAGRDKTGDLVDCAALPNGPAEFKGVDLLHVAQTVCAPFGITVRADVDIGAPFTRLSAHPHDTAMAFLESAARQRAVLLVSDGVGGLVLTRGGSSRAPAPLRMGELVQRADFEEDWDHRFSDYFVKGQTDAQGHRAGVAAPLTSSVTPLTSTPTPAGAPGAASAKEASSIVMTGHAIDPEMNRWRPTVRLTRSQSGMSTTQAQAEWMLRVAKGQSTSLRYVVLGCRAGSNNVLWRPNQVTTVYDPYAGIDRDMLIAGVRFEGGPEGVKTSLRVVGVTAYDLINEAAKKRSPTPSKAATSGPLTTTVSPLTAQ